MTGGVPARQELAEHATLWASKNPRARLIFAHGAGAARDSAFICMQAEAIAQQGIEVLTFDFAYMVQRRHSGRKRPPNPVTQLAEEYRQRLAFFMADTTLPIFIGGKSMGGRVATMIDVSEVAIAGMVCFGYPFHPQGRPEVLRIEHLFNLAIPLQIIQGTRDALGNAEQVARYRLPQSIALHWLIAADHDFKPLKSSGLTQRESIADAARATCTFIDRCLHE